MARIIEVPCPYCRAMITMDPATHEGHRDGSCVNERLRSYRFIARQQFARRIHLETVAAERHAREGAMRRLIAEQAPARIEAAQLKRDRRRTRNAATRLVAR